MLFAHLKRILRLDRAPYHKRLHERSARFCEKDETGQMPFQSTRADLVAFPLLGLILSITIRVLQ
jgi:hypothetical protein